MFNYLDSSTVTSIVVLLALINISYRLFRHYSSGLTSIPGPFLAKFSRLWLLRETYYGRFHLEDLSIHQKHGVHISFIHRMSITNLYKRARDSNCSWAIQYRRPGLCSNDLWEQMRFCQGNSNLQNQLTSSLMLAVFMVSNKCSTWPSARQHLCRP